VSKGGVQRILWMKPGEEQFEANLFALYMCCEKVYTAQVYSGYGDGTTRAEGLNFASRCLVFGQQVNKAIDALLKNLLSAELWMFRLPAIVSSTGSVFFRQATIVSPVGQFTFRATWREERKNTIA